MLQQILWRHSHRAGTHHYSPVKDTVFILHADNRSLTRITLVALLTGLTLVTCLTFLSGLTFVSLLSLHTIGNSNNLSVREDNFITIFLLVYGNDGDSIFILLHDSLKLGNICIHILAESFQFAHLRLKDIHSGRKFCVIVTSRCTQTEHCSSRESQNLFHKL